MSGTDMQTVAVLNWCVAVLLTLALAHSLFLSFSVAVSLALALAHLSSPLPLYPSRVHLQQSKIVVMRVHASARVTRVQAHAEAMGGGGEG
eukprot:3155308-Rhodomonas_salina.1